MIPSFSYLFFEGFLNQTFGLFPSMAERPDLCWTVEPVEPLNRGRCFEKINRDSSALSKSAFLFPGIVLMNVTK
jgi:hypothetical protein